MADGLQARGWVEITQGGYYNEDRGVCIDGQCFQGATNSAVNVPFKDVGETGEMTVTYNYRDSNYPGNDHVYDLNKSSSRVDVTMKTTWQASKGSNNTYIVKSITSLIKLERCCKNESLGAISYNPTRTINLTGTLGNVIKNLINSPANTGVFWSGNMKVSEDTYTIKPGEQVSPNQLTCVYLNYSTGRWSPGQPLPNIHVDEMRMGVQFKNNLPDRCDPPALMSVTQTDDICENNVEACLRFAPCSCEGMGIRLEYRFDGESWEDAHGLGQYVEREASNIAPFNICLDKLPPTNHTAQPVILYWRAKYYPITATMPETEWTSGNFDMMFILAPHETVPDISPQECSYLERGELIGKYEQETCYNDTSCADMVVNR